MPTFNDGATVVVADRQSIEAISLSFSPSLVPRYSWMFPFLNLLTFSYLYMRRCRLLQLSGIPSMTHRDRDVERSGEVKDSREECKLQAVKNCIDYTEGG